VGAASTLYTLSPSAPYVLNGLIMTGVLAYVLVSPRIRAMRG
jgi:hypothetical protein